MDAPGRSRTRAALDRVDRPRGGRSTSTVGVRTSRSTGCRSSHAAKHAAAAASAREPLRELVERGMSVRQIGMRAEHGASRASRHWLGEVRAQDRTRMHYVAARRGQDRQSTLRECPTPRVDGLRRARARVPSTAARSARWSGSPRVAAAIKEILVEEAGGQLPHLRLRQSTSGALHFHHQDPTTKRFEVSHAGTTGSLECHASRRPGNACYCAQTATRRWKPGWCFWPSLRR